MRGLGGLVGLLLCLAAASVQAAITPYTPDANTAVLYHLDEATGTASTGPTDYVVVDATGNVPLRTDLASPFDGTNGPDELATAMTSWTSWKRAYRDSGADTSVFSTTQFTVEAWVRDPGTLGGGLGTDVNTIFRVAAAGDIQFAVEDVSDEKKLRLKYNRSGGTTTLYSNTVTFDSEAWYHAAVTYDDNGAGTPDDSTVTFYLTAEASYHSGLQPAGQATGAEDLEGLTGSGLVSVGETFGADNFDGYLDEVRYLNGVRSGGGPIPEPGATVFVGLLALSLSKRALLAAHRRR